MQSRRVACVKSPTLNDISAAVSIPPDRLAAARQAELRPFFGHRADDVFIHRDLAAPFALGLGRQLVGGVQADLGAEPALRRGEVEIVDRRVFDDA